MLLFSLPAGRFRCDLVKQETPQRAADPLESAAPSAPAALLCSVRLPALGQGVERPGTERSAGYPNAFVALPRTRLGAEVHGRGGTGLKRGRRGLLPPRTQAGEPLGLGRGGLGTREAWPSAVIKFGGWRR